MALNLVYCSERDVMKKLKMDVLSLKFSLFNAERKCMYLLNVAQYFLKMLF